MSDSWDVGKKKKSGLNKGTENAVLVAIVRRNQDREYIENNEVDLVIFDDDLTAKQTNILEEMFKRKIIDPSSDSS